MLQDTRQCPICSQNRTRELVCPKRSPGPVVSCQNCGLVYVSPIEKNQAIIRKSPSSDKNLELLTSADLQDIADCWELPSLLVKSEEQTAFYYNATDALNRIEQLVHAPGSLLDFGCGGGFFLGEAKKRGWETYGLEPLPGHAVYARAKSGATVITDVLQDDTFSPGSFDVITAFQVFEHLPDPAGDLGRLNRILKPGGIILIEVPNIDTWSMRLLGSRHRHFVQDHITFFSPRTLGLLLEKQGFEVLDTYYPIRRMTIRHLVANWGGRYLPNSVASALKAIAQRLGFWDNIVSINLADIVAIIGRVPKNPGSMWPRS